MTTTGFADPPLLVPEASLAQIGEALANRPYAKRGVSFTDRHIRVLLVDDHTLVRRALRYFLQRAATDIEVVGEASGGREAVEIAARLLPDVVVMDLDMAAGDGETATRALRERLPQTHVLILSVHSEDEKLLPLLRAGARGYLSKEAAEQELVDAIRVVATGDVYVRPQIARRLAARQSVTAPDARALAARRYATLSARERQVVRFIAEGYNGPEIGEQLGITAKTVDTYKQRIEDKLGLTHRTDYVHFALECGLLQPHPELHR